MRISKLVYCFCLSLAVMLAISQPISVLAITPLEEGERRLHIDVTYPSVEVQPGGTVEFEINVRYATYHQEGEPLNFDIVTTAPKNWGIYVTERYAVGEKTRIRSIRLDPAFSTPTNLMIVVAPPYWYVPEPGEYTVTVELISEDEELRNSIDLITIIPATYILSLVPSTGRYNTSARAGRDNYFITELVNIGSATIDDITFSSDRPEGWSVTFYPDEIDSLSADSSREIQVNITPPPRTIAGDYLIILNCEGNQTSAEKFDLRVTVETPTIWGWVGVVVILLVIAGIVFVFIRFSRR